MSDVASVEAIQDMLTAPAQPVLPPAKATVTPVVNTPKITVQPRVKNRKCPHCNKMQKVQGYHTHVAGCRHNTRIKLNIDAFTKHDACGLFISNKNYERHAATCNGDTADALENILSAERSYIRKVYGLEKRTTSFPQKAVRVVCRMMKQRGMPKDWVIGKDLRVEAWVPVISEPTPVKDKAQPKVTTSDFVDAEELAMLMAEKMGIPRLLANIEEFNQWKTLTEALLNV